MKIAITILIIIGIAIMISNIVRYAIFLHTTHDVLSSGSKRDRYWKTTALILLIFFLIGYIFIVIASKPDLMMAMILFGGSIFVAIVLTLMFNLLETAKERSIDIAEVLVGVIDARDPNLNGHSRHVQNLTMLFYKYLPSSIRNDINPVSLEYAALMHDVGKLGVPERDTISSREIRFRWLHGSLLLQIPTLPSPCDAPTRNPAPTRMRSGY